MHLRFHSALVALMGGLALPGAGCLFAEPAEAPLGPTAAQANVVEKLDVLTALGKARGFTTMIRLIGASGLDATLRSEGPWTLLAPSDDAFARLPEGTLDNLLRPEGKDELQALVKNHILEAHVDSDDLRKRAHIETLGGAKLKVEAEGTRLRLDGALLEALDLDARNGVVHALDSVLMPMVKEETKEETKEEEKKKEKEEEEKKEAK